MVWIFNLQNSYLDIFSITYLVIIKPLSVILCPSLCSFKIGHIFWARYAYGRAIIMEMVVYIVSYMLLFAYIMGI